MTHAFLLASIAILASWAGAIWLLYPLLAPRGDITTRVMRGRQVGAYVAAGVAAVTTTRAIASSGDVNNLIAIAILSPMAWLLGFAIGWTIGPPSVGLPYAPVQIPVAGDSSPGVTEERFWSEAIAEFESVDRRNGVWAEALATAQGNESVAKARYLRKRSSQMSEQYRAQHIAEMQVLKSGKETEDRQVQALNSAIAAGDILQIRNLLAGGVDIEQPNRWGLSPLVCAEQHGRKEILELIQRHARTPRQHSGT